jgi:hypothetical protein
MKTQVQVAPPDHNLDEVHARENPWQINRGAIWAGMICCWLIEAFSYRHTVFPDANSYFDLAWFCVRGHWKGLVNGYWSPAFPVLLSFPLRILHGHLQEIMIAHLTNVLVLIGALACFEYLFKELENYAALHWLAFEETERGLAMPYLRATGYALFFWLSLYATPPSQETPDALAMALVLLAAGILVRIASGTTHWFWFAALGAVLGIGYLAKAALFLLAFVFLSAAALASKNWGRAVRGLLAGLLTFAFVAGPFVLLLSKSKGRFTFGDSGAINYAEFVDGVKLLTNWQGGPPGSGMPIHPTRKLMSSPAVFEFATPIEGTYPPSNDQSYWYDGVRPHFELKGQLLVLWRTIDDYFSIFVKLGAMAAGFGVLLGFGGGLQEYWPRFRRLYFLWVPGLAALALYALVYTELRYVAGFILLLWAAAFFSLRVPRNGMGESLEKAATVAILMLLGAQITWSMTHAAFRAVSKSEFVAADVVAALREAGVQSGDPVAVIGNPPTSGYWAHLAGIKIVEEIPDEEIPNFLSANSDQRIKSLRVLGETGAKVVVSSNLPQEVLQRGWQPIPNTPYELFLLKK